MPTAVIDPLERTARFASAAVAETPVLLKTAMAGRLAVAAVALAATAVRVPKPVSDAVAAVAEIAPASA
jgi:hypothetical protein